ncbi:glycosyltransferase family 2 protein [Patulibacter brassicae]|uniref:Glycosyltransferase family 2 protein n=1 Tax=Patulibacter brassicae TaxID=1705717 RepID=A0ABU4VIM2_9ACTN|nr:glycosyltransferase family 2 protein [Patulibacter brassicae]MDX8151686.1 glycosyltransferase family 2 protein [Patulibacter brassicae]
MDPELVVQIVNFRTRDVLGPCLDGVLADLDDVGIPHRVLVLENGSGDDLSDLVAARGDRVELLVGARNLGFGGGHNRLAAAARSPWLCCVNPDVTIPRPGVLRGLLRHGADPRVVAVGPLLRTEDGAPQRWDHGELRGVRAAVARGAGHSHWRTRSRPVPAAWVSGAFLLLRRSAFDAVGGFDEGFFLYKEEEDLCLRLRGRGGRIVYDPTVSAGHVGGVVARRDEHLDASLARFRAKHVPPLRGAACDWLFRNVTRRI